MCTSAEIVFVCVCVFVHVCEMYKIHQIFI